VAVAELTVRVMPRADADRVGPYADGMLRVRVTRPPADGEANRAVIRLVAGALSVPPSTLTLVAGARSRTKRYAVSGLSAAELLARLSTLGD
jgi:Uncharacterized conserved protein